MQAQQCPLERFERDTPGIHPSSAVLHFIRVNLLFQAELISFALEDLARSCLYHIVLAFGPSIKDVLKDAKQRPVFGSAADVTGLFLGMLELKE